MYYKCHKVSFRHDGSYIDSPTTNLKNEDDKCFQYVATVALNCDDIKCNPERVSNIKPFINKYNLEGINYPSKIDDWKTFEKNNPTIAINILYVKEKILPAYISEHNSTRDIIYADIESLIRKID